MIAGVTSNFLTDALGSPIAVTNNSGVVQTEYTYEPFGKTTVSGASNTSSYQYTDRENDGTGLYYYRARFYSPRLQRFISEDPIEFKGGDANLYAYVWNRPLALVDPVGLAGISVGPGITGVFGSYAGTVGFGVYFGSGGYGVYGTLGTTGGGAIISCCVNVGYYPGNDPGGQSTNFEVGFGKGSASASFNQDGSFAGAAAGKLGPSIGAAGTDSKTGALCLVGCDSGPGKAGMNNDPPGSGKSETGKKSKTES